MRTSIFAALILSAALGTAPAAFAASLTPAAESATSALAYTPVYTESDWMTLTVPLSQLGGSLPADLTLSASGLPSGTSVTLTDVTQEGSDALLTISVARNDVTTAVNANSLITLSSGGQMLTSFNVPVIGAASSGE